MERLYCMCTGEGVVTNQYVKCVSQNHEEEVKIYIHLRLERVCSGTEPYTI
jgi:hypothetical protein